MSDIFISPRFRSDFLSDSSPLEDKIAVFEDQTRGWLIAPAIKLLDGEKYDPNMGFASLALCLIYVDTIACFIKGKTSEGQGREFFVFGLKEIFQEILPDTLDTFGKEIYRELRCGLIHQGLTRGKVRLQRETTLFSAAIGLIWPPGVESLYAIIVNPERFLDSVEDHFNGYLRRLRDPKEVDAKHAFETWFDSRAL